MASVAREDVWPPGAAVEKHDGVRAASRRGVGTRPVPVANRSRRERFFGVMPRPSDARESVRALAGRGGKARAFARLGHPLLPKCSVRGDGANDASMRSRRGQCRAATAPARPGGDRASRSATGRQRSGRYKCRVGHDVSGREQIPAHSFAAFDSLASGTEKKPEVSASAETTSAVGVLVEPIPMIASPVFETAGGRVSRGHEEVAALAPFDPTVNRGVLRQEVQRELVDSVPPRPPLRGSSVRHDP